MGWNDVVLLERDRLTSGTTWHAAGLMVTFGSTSETSTEMRKYTRDLYARLEAETGQATGFKPVGFIEVAADADRLEEYRRVSAFNRYCGVDVHEISPREVARAVPARPHRRHPRRLLRRRTTAASNPVDVTMALAKGARMQGATILEGVPVTGVLDAARRGHRRAHRRTATSRPSTSSTAPACGRASSARRSGVNIPLQAAEHYYLITEQIDGRRPRRGRCSRIPASYGYFREEVGGLMIGLFEPVCAPWNVDGMPERLLVRRDRSPTGIAWARTSRRR